MLGSLLFVGFKTHWCIIDNVLERPSLRLAAVNDSGSDRLLGLNSLRKVASEPLF